MQGRSDAHVRCFIAAFLESASVDLLASEVQLPAGLRRVDRADWHVTLKFLGSTPRERVPELLDVVAALAGCSSVAEVTGFIGLPRAAHARVVAAELRESAQLSAWAEQLARRLGPEDRRFRPHVTVARCGRPIRFAGQTLAQPLRIVLKAPALYRSHSGGDRPGARYEQITG